MDNFQFNLAFFIIIFSIIALVLFSVLDRKKFLRIRPLKALLEFKKVFGFSIEQGKRMHISLGWSKIEEAQGAASLIALDSMTTYSQQSLLGDKPPIITSGSGDLTLLSQDIIKKSYRMNNAIDKYSVNRAFLTGISPYSYVAGGMPILTKDIATQSVIGHYGPEAGLLVESALRGNIYSLAATDSLTGQATMFALADEVLIGEELYAIPSLIDENSTNNASLHTQDLLRYLAIFALILSALLKLVGIV